MQFVLGLVAVLLSFVALTLYGFAMLAWYTVAATDDENVCCSLGQAESVFIYCLIGGILVNIIAGAIWIVFFFRIMAQDADPDTPNTADD